MPQDEKAHPLKGLVSVMEECASSLPMLLSRLAGVIKDREEDFLGLGATIFGINSQANTFSATASAMASSVGEGALHAAIGELQTRADEAKAVFSSVSSTEQQEGMSEVLGLIRGLDGNDAITAGAGDTVLGGEGIDVLYSSDATLNVISATHIEGVDLIDLRGSATSLTVNGDAILRNGFADLVGRKALVVHGDAGDVVALSDDSWTWALAKNQNIGTYTVYEGVKDGETVRLYVQNGVLFQLGEPKGSASVGELYGVAETQGTGGAGEISGYIDESLQLKLSMNPDQDISPLGSACKKS